MYILIMYIYTYSGKKRKLSCILYKVQTKMQNTKGHYKFKAIILECDVFGVVILTKKVLGWHDIILKWQSIIMLLKQNKQLQLVKGVLFLYR